MLVEALTPQAKMRFMNRVKVYPGSDCWLYTGDPGRERPRVTINNVKADAYRWMWAIAHGRDPEGLVLHSCDVARCVNPAHLREGTHHDNNMDAVERGRVRNQFTGREKCKRGHDLTGPDAFYVAPSGRRECKRCKAQRRNAAQRDVADPGSEDNPDRSG